MIRKERVPFGILSHVVINPISNNKVSGHKGLKNKHLTHRLSYGAFYTQWR